MSTFLPEPMGRLQGWRCDTCGNLSPYVGSMRPIHCPHCPREPLPPPAPTEVEALRARVVALETALRDLAVLADRRCEEIAYADQVPRRVARSEEWSEVGERAREVLND